MKTLFVDAGIGVVGLLGLASFLGDVGGTGAEPVLPAAEPVERLSVAPAPVAAVPDVSDLWRTSTGEVCHFDQQGGGVSFTAEAAGQAFCQVLQPAADHRSWTGMCIGPNEAFPAQMFRSITGRHRRAMARRWLHRAMSARRPPARLASNETPRRSPRPCPRSCTTIRSRRRAAR